MKTSRRLPLVQKGKILFSHAWPVLLVLCLFALLPSNRQRAYAFSSTLLASSASPAEQLVVDFDSDVTAGEAPLLVAFSDRSSGAPTAWQWDFGDGATSTEQNPTHLYQSPGGYTVTLTVSNALGSDTVTRATYIIANSEPVIDVALPPDLPSLFEDAAGPAEPTPQGGIGGTQAVTAEPNAPVLQNPTNGTTGVSNPSTSLETCVSDPDGNPLTVTFYGRDVSPINVPDFTIAVLPDTQNYYSADGKTAATFLAQTQWIVNNRASRNIVFVSHLGDMVNDGSVPGAGKASEQWATADVIMRTIEDQSLTTLLDGIPYGIAVGNHDQGPSFGDPSKTQLYNQYFGVNRFQGRGYYGGHLGSDNDNSFQLFSVGDLKFIHIDLEFDTSSRPATFAWVDTLLDTYPDRWAILSAHELVHHTGEWRPQGLKVWENIRDHANVLLTLSGHIGGENRRQDTGYHGNLVHSFLSDYQNRANGGDGWMRYMEFKGAQSNVTVYTYSVTKNAYENDATSFFNAAFDTPATGPMRRPFQIIGKQSNVPSGSCTSVTWNGLAGNRQYEWYVGVSDSPNDAGDVQAFSPRATFSTGAGTPTNSVKLNNTAYTVNENSGAATITVDLNRVNEQAVTVNYATSNGTASAGTDYTAANGTLTFAAAETSKTFTVPIVDDTVYENNETVNLTLSSPGNAVLANPSGAVLTIVDNDPMPTVQFSSVTYNVNENAGTATITANLNAASTLPVTVNYATSNGTATAPGDYTAATGTLTFAPGETSKSFTVSIVKDGTTEADETVTLTLNTPTGATLGTPATATLTIVDSSAPTVQFSNATYSVNENAGTATINVSLSAAASAAVTVEYLTSNGTATAGSDYTTTSGTLTFAPGQTSQSFTVPILDDTTKENNETVTLTLRNPASASLGTPATATLTITDTSPTPTVQFSSATYAVNENAGTATITVLLSNPSVAQVKVEYLTSNGTANTGSDYTTTSGTLTFNAGETSKSFTVPILADSNSEPDETVNLTIRNPSGATLGTPDKAILTISETIAVAPTAQFSSATYSANEGDGSATITVVLSSPATSGVTVNYATADESATAAVDYTATSGSLTFAPGEASQSFTVQLLDDSLDENDERVALSLSSTDLQLGAPTAAVLTIGDNDEPPVIGFSRGEYTVRENEQVAVITVTLSQPSGLTVTVTYASQDNTATGDSDYKPVTGTLVFAPGQTSQSFTVKVTEDTVAEETESLQLNLVSNTNAVSGNANSTLVLILNDPRYSLFIPLIRQEP